MGANVLVELEILFYWGLFIFKLGANGGKCVVEFENVFLIGGSYFNGGIFFKLGAMGANVLMEFENVFLIGGIFFTLEGKKLFWDRENQLFWELYGPLT